MRYVTRRGRFYKIDNQGNRYNISKEEWLLGKNVNTTPISENVREEEVETHIEEETRTYEQETVFESESGSEEEI